jgi:hypothetical protein
MYLLLSIFLVVFAFLELLYFDKVWGTWRDYVVALTFGITGKVVLDKFNDALSGLVSLKTDR